MDPSEPPTYTLVEDILANLQAKKRIRPRSSRRRKHVEPAPSPSILATTIAEKESFQTEDYRNVMNILSETENLLEKTSQLRKDLPPENTSPPLREDLSVVIPSKEEQERDKVNSKTKSKPKTTSTRKSKSAPLIQTWTCRICSKRNVCSVTECMTCGRHRSTKVAAKKRETNASLKAAIRRHSHSTNRRKQRSLFTKDKENVNLHQQNSYRPTDVHKKVMSITRAALSPTSSGSSF